MRHATVLGLAVPAVLGLGSSGSGFLPAPGPWSAAPRVGNAVGHSLTFMMRISRTQRITEINMDYEGDVVTCTFRNEASGNWLVGEHLLHLRRPIDHRHRFSVPMSGTALNQGAIPGATVHYELRITGQFTSRHRATGTVEFRQGCTLAKPYAPWQALG